MLNLALIGIGNCGNQIAALAQKEANVSVACINTSENDLAILPDSLKDCSFMIGDHQGSGKNRADAKRFLKDSVTKLVSDEKFQKIIADKDVILVASSTGGGTGSGIAPIMSSIIRQTFRDSEGKEKPIILLGVLPKLSEGQSTQMNTLEYLHELYELLEDEQPTYMLYDNNNYAKESGSTVLQKVNADIVSDLKVLQLTYNTPTPYDSIDEKDMKQICLVPGRMVIASAFGIKEKDLDEKDIEDLLIQNLKSNSHAEIQRDGIVGNTGLITNLSEKLNATFDTHLPKVFNFIGDPIQEFLHIAVNKERDMPNNVALIVSGMSKITDRIDKIEERIEEINQRKEEQASARRNCVIDTEQLEKFNEQKNSRATSGVETQADLKSTFSKFGL